MLHWLHLETFILNLHAAKVDQINKFDRMRKRKKRTKWKHQIREREPMALGVVPACQGFEVDLDQPCTLKLHSSSPVSTRCRKIADYCEKS